ncbi:MAG: PAS domain S-box protein [Acetobacteraceae bacterium]|nr:PAS domain S-box protein [Acetobacteraceae bacterium]
MDGNLAQTRQMIGEAARQGAARGRGVRVHLILLTLMALLPAWCLAGYAAWRFAAIERSRLLGIGQDAARDIATDVDREIAAMRASLAALATSPALIAGDLAAFDRQLALLHGGGAVSVSLEPAPEGAAVGTDPVLDHDAARGRAVLMFRHAVTGDRADPAMLVLRTDAALFWSAILERARLPEGWVASVLDARHVILARFPDPARFIGRSVHPNALAVLQAAPAEAPGGWGVGSTRLGEPVRIAWRRVAGEPWTVLVGVPAAAVDGALWRAMLPVLLVGLPLLAGLTLATAVWGARRIARPLRRLEAAAGAVGRHAIPEPPATSGVREIDAASHALVAAAARLGAREEEIAALAARLEAVLESTTDCVVVLDRRLRLIYENGRARSLLHRAVGKDGDWPLGRGSAFVEGFDRAFRTGAPVSVTAAVAAGLVAPTARWFAADAFPSPQGLTVFFRDVTAAREAEEALRAGEARLQAVLDHVPVGVVLAEAPSGRIVLTNRRLAEMLAVPAVRAETVEGYASYPVYDGEGRPVPPEARAIARAITGGNSVRDEYRFRRADGHLVWARVMAAPIRDASGGITGAVAAITAIEAERQAEAALRESELRFRALAEAVPQIVWASGPDGVVDYLNARYFEFIGLAPVPPAEAGELPIHPEDRAATAAAWHAALATGVLYEAEYRLRRADGAWRWFVARGLPVRGADDAIRRWIGTATDVTELIETRQALERQVAAEAAARQAAVQAAEALAASEARFRGFGEASPDVLWMLDPDSGRLTYLSPAYEVLWGEPPPEPATLAVLTRGLDAVDAAQVAALEPRIRAGEAVQAELRIHRADGQSRWIRLTSFAIADASPQGVRVGGFARDITRRQEADERQRLLIGELNHRVKNTLATVLSLARQTERSARRALAASAEAGGAEGPAADAGFVADFQARLMALARGHDLLTASTWRGAMLGEVAAASLLPWRGEEDRAARIALEGPPVWLAPRQALGLALAIHEMATNAAKHGALRSPEGRVSLRWERDANGRVEAQWVESGGLPVTPPVATGFGTRLLRQGLGTELGPESEITLDYPPEGFRATMRFLPLRDGDETI